MIKIPFVPQRQTYGVALPNDVITASYSAMPIAQRLNTNLPYTVDISFILNGINHDILLDLWRANKAEFVEIQLRLEDSQLRWYECLFIDSPQIVPLLGYHQPWTVDQINDGGADTANCYYESTWQVVARQPHRAVLDEQIVSTFEANHPERFPSFNFEV